MTIQQLGSSLVRFARHPATRVFVGASLLITGFADVLEDITGVETILSVYHGVTVFGIQHVMHALGEMFEGVSKTSGEEG